VVTKQLESLYRLHAIRVNLNRKTKLYNCKKEKGKTFVHLYRNGKIHLTVDFLLVQARFNIKVTIAFYKSIRIRLCKNFYLF